MNIPVWWYLARATGLVAFVAMAASLAVGVVLTTRLFPDRRRPAWLLDVHRWVSGIAVVALGGHLAALVADSYLRFGPLQLLVPYTSAWRPGAVALGVLSLWLLVLATLAAVVRRRLPRGVWRWVHRSSYLAFWLGAVHAATAGSDVGHPAYRVVAALLLTGVVFLTVYRVAVTEPPPRSRPRTAPARAGRSEDAADPIAA